MHDIKANYDKIGETFETFFKNEMDVNGNFRFCPNPPRIPDMQAIALSPCAESTGINSENYFLYKPGTGYRDDLPPAHITRYDKNRIALAGRASGPAGHICRDLSLGEGVSIVDPMPIPVCKSSREHRTKAFRENFETARDKGYCAVDQQYRTGHKPHLATALNGAYGQMDITRASVRDTGFPNDIGNGGQVGCATPAGRPDIYTGPARSIFPRASR